jgi:transposase
VPSIAKASKPLKAVVSEALMLARRIKGRKRHIIVDTLGLMVGLMVHSADIQDRDGAPDLLKSIRNRWPWLLHVFADGGYAGDKLKKRLQKIGKWTLEIIKRSDKAKGFEILPRRWVVERTFRMAWVDAAGWPRTSKNPSLQQKRG